MNISIASDHAGFEQKTALAAYLRELGHQVTDLGPDTDERVDYPDFAALVERYDVLLVHGDVLSASSARVVGRTAEPPANAGLPFARLRRAGVSSRRLRIASA